MKIWVGMLVLWACCTTVFAAQKKVIPPVENYEWWRTKEACVEAKKFVNYIPRTASSAVIPPGLFPGGLPHRACLKTNLPEINVAEAWVRQGEGAPTLLGKDASGNLVPMMMPGCHNKITDFVYLPDPVAAGPLPKGDKGDKGDPGPPGVAPNVIVENNPNIIINLPKEEKKAEPAPLPRLPPEKGWWDKHWPWVLAGAAGVGTGVLLAVCLSDDDTPPTQVSDPSKNPVIIIRSSTRIGFAFRW